MREALPRLTQILADMSVLKAHFLSTNLVTYNEYCKIENEARPEASRDLLSAFIGRGNEEEFWRFLHCLSSEARFQQIAKDLEQKAVEEGFQCTETR